MYEEFFLQGCCIEMHYVTVKVFDILNTLCWLLSCLIKLCSCLAAASYGCAQSDTHALKVHFAHKHRPS